MVLDSKNIVACNQLHLPKLLALKLCSVCLFGSKAVVCQRAGFAFWLAVDKNL